MTQKKFWEKLGNLARRKDLRWTWSGAGGIRIISKNKKHIFCPITLVAFDETKKDFCCNYELAAQAIDLNAHFAHEIADAADNCDCLYLAPKLAKKLLRTINRPNLEKTIKDNQW